MGLSLADYAVTEAGFGADLGAEKFMNIKCGYGGLRPSAIVIVATIRALRHHGGAKKEEYNTPSMERVQSGFANLEKHIENCKAFGISPTVAINFFPTDTQEEINEVISRCAAMGVKAVVSKGFSEGGKGTAELAAAVVDSIHQGKNTFTPLYDWSLPVKQKIEKIATTIYGAEGVNYSKQAEKDLKTIEKLGLSALPVCMAKTQKSFSDDETRIGRPRGFNVTVREFEFATGAGFIIPILGDMMRMPGLPVIPASEGMDISDSGVISGLS
jgi:formate--tetrahydrofolate ligase